MKCSHTSMNFSGTWIELKICHLENNLNTEHSQTHKKIKKQWDTRNKYLSYNKKQLYIRTEESWLALTEGLVPMPAALED